MPGRLPRLALVAWAGALAPAAGCAYGPRTLEQAHNRYSVSVKRVAEEQLLRTLLHLRYDEAPVGLDVASIAAQYEATVGAEARPFFSTEATGNLFRAFDTILPAFTGSLSNRPTFSLVPDDDGNAVRRFLTPVSPDTLVFLAQTGWPVSVILRLYVERLNGVPNAVTASGPPRPLEPDFERFLRAAELFQEAQDRELLAVASEDRGATRGPPVPADQVTPALVLDAAKSGYEYRPTGDGERWALTKPERRLTVRVNPGGEGSPQLAELTGLLNLAPGRPAYDVVPAVRGDPDPARHPVGPSEELRIATRSNAQVLFYLANGIDVPAGHGACGLALPGHRRELTRGLFAVHHCRGGLHPPADAYVAVRYRGYWFYIDDRDRETKQTFALILQLRRLDFARQQFAVPALTLPVGR